jgi:hypothetical protein
MRNGYRYDEDTKAYLKKNGLPEDEFVKPVQMAKEL